jgi:hypothetical protein
MATLEQVKAGIIEVGRQMFVDACSDVSTVNAVIGYRLGESCEILAVYHTPSCETRGVTAVGGTSGDTGPTGPELPGNHGEAWVVISKAPAPPSP